MKTLLHINTSLFSDKGQSSALAARYVERWQAANPGGRVIERNLAEHPVAHLGAERFQAFLADAADLTPTQRLALAESDTFIEELRAADAVVIGLPMYNFGVPSVFKAWIDHVARVGVTFRYTANGPEGLLDDRKVMVFAARGGIYLGTPRDTQTDYVTHVLNFIGLRDIEFVYAEGLAMGEDIQRQALEQAHSTIDALAA
ncbi:FMN-dependent NADH-azoreductase [Marinihelvus fidelis]|uniref:FMN dependent NADH:quinone oxidoreductase n=1 Tax=Marinihelvus fidelis TaxID=2613842 RepID=A0A5N0TC90_9GAMM|nr:NAD(P)H-dependent oxidoreductase [Marinihelvus fidelis]KAA9132703.1 FMN-dependent NADH-azoreductase [Marinihelvus fidelis]